MNAAATLGRPKEGDYSPLAGNYIALVSGEDPVEALSSQMEETLQLLRAIPEGKGGHRYASGKWTIREVIGHLSDAERIMSYRALRFARADKTELSGFEENDYVRNSNFNERTLQDLSAEFEAVRHATLYLFKSPKIFLTLREVMTQVDVCQRA